MVCRVKPGTDVIHGVRPIELDVARAGDLAGSAARVAAILPCLSRSSICGPDTIATSRHLPKGDLKNTNNQ
jgi:hypothetical protein